MKSFEKESKQYLPDDFAYSLHSQDDEEKVEEKNPILPTYITLERPNTLRTIKNTIIFVFQLKYKSLPACVSIAGRAKCKYQSFVSFTTDLPDENTCDLSFDTPTYNITHEYAKYALEQVMKSPQRYKEGIESLNGIPLAHSKARGKPIKSINPKLIFTSSNGGISSNSPIKVKTEASDGSDFLGSKPFGGFRFQNLNKPISLRDIPSRDILLEQDKNIDEREMEESLLTMTVRLITNSPLVAITVSTNKQQTMRRESLKDHELFSSKGLELLNKTIERNNQDKKQLMEMVNKNLSWRLNTSNSSKFNITGSPIGKNRIRMNKNIARKFNEHRRAQLNILSQETDPDIELHQTRAKSIKIGQVEFKKMQIKITESKRLTEKNDRLEKEVRKLLIPKLCKWITILRIFSTLEGIKNRFILLSDERNNLINREMNALKIQTEWRRFMFRKNGPKTRRERRLRDVFFCVKYQMSIMGKRSKQKAHSNISKYLCVCLDRSKFKNVFLQSALYCNLPIKQ